jgi:1,4-dihydroxy-2-naphthoate octaprenyltransferase
MATAAEWIAGARPRTLPAAIAPVAVGTGIAVGAGAFLPMRALLALVVAVALQVGVNFANDYSDGIRGTDTVRIGPVRLVGQGLANPSRVRAAAIGCFVLAALAGFTLVLLTSQWWLLGVGAVSIAAAWLYTGGPRPYGYLGLGEMFVFVFFGVVPVMGTAYVQTLTLTWNAAIASVGVGLLACVILLANNLRDIPTDVEHGKRTLAVRIGDAHTRTLYQVFVALAFVIVVVLAFTDRPTALIALIAVPPALVAIRRIRSGAIGPELIAVLQQSGVVLLLYGVGLGIGLGIG